MKTSRNIEAGCGSSGRNVVGPDDRYRFSVLHGHNGNCRRPAVVHQHQRAYSSSHHFELRHHRRAHALSSLRAASSQYQTPQNRNETRKQQSRRQNDRSHISTDNRSPLLQDGNVRQQPPDGRRQSHLRHDVSMVSSRRPTVLAHNSFHQLCWPNTIEEKSCGACDEHTARTSVDDAGGVRCSG